LNDIELTDKLKSDIDEISLFGTPSFDKDKDKV
jgi:hypothetical protein